MVQTYSEDKKIYLVDLMFMYVNYKNIISKKIKTHKLFSLLKYKCWVNYNNKMISPIEIFKNKDLSLKHYKRIQKADLRYPIMISTSSNWIVDGMHRLSKSYLHKKKYILKKLILGKTNIIINIILIH